MFCLPPEGVQRIIVEEAKRHVENERKIKEKLAFSEYKSKLFKEVDKDNSNIELKELSRSKSEPVYSKVVIQNLYPFKTQDDINNHWKSFSNSRGK